MKGDLYLAAEGSNSTYDNPRWCRIPAAHVAPLLCELQRCREIIQKCGVDGVHVKLNAASWGPSAVAEDLGIGAAELVVKANSFLVRTWPEGTAPVDTVYMSIDGFEDSVRKGTRCFVWDTRLIGDAHARDEASILMVQAEEDEARSAASAAA